MALDLNIDPAHRLEEIEFGIENMAAHAEHLKPVFNVIATKIMNRNKRAFETRGATTGKYWSPLKNSTIKSKRASGFLNPESPLRATDVLMDSLSVRGAAHQILRITDDELAIGTSVDYAGFHLTGFMAKGTHVPARPPMTIARSHMAEYIKDIRKWVFEGELPNA